MKRNDLSSFIQFKAAYTHSLALPSHLRSSRIPLHPMIVYYCYALFAMQSCAFLLLIPYCGLLSTMDSFDDGASTRVRMTPYSNAFAFV